MKDLSLLVWLTQLGLSVALPPAGFILLAVWLRNQFELGQWVIWIAVVLGLVCAVDGLRSSLKAMSAMSKKKSEREDGSPVSFNEHE